MTQKLLRLCPIVFLLACATQLLAQSQIPVTGHISAAGNNPSNPTLYQVQFQMAYCGANVPRVFGIGTIAASTASFTADSNGLVTGSIWPNDVITCGGVAGNTRYNISYVTNGSRVGPMQCFQIVSTMGTFNLDTAQPCVIVPPPTPPPGTPDAHVNNLTVDGLLSGHNASFSGDVTALTFHFLTSGNHFACPGGQFANALRQDFTFGCAAPSSAPVSSVFGRTGAVAAVSGDYGFSLISGKVASGQMDSTLTYPGTYNKAQIWDHTPTFSTCAASAGHALASASTDTAGNLTCTYTSTLPALTLSFDAATSDTCIPATSTDSSCTGTITLPSSMGDANYSPAFGVAESSGAFLSITITGAITATTIPYVLSCSFNCSVINQPAIHVIAVHH